MAVLPSSGKRLQLAACSACSGTENEFISGLHSFSFHLSPAKIVCVCWGRGVIGV